MHLNRDSHIASSSILQSSFLRKNVEVCERRKLLGYMEFFKFDVTIKKNWISKIWRPQSILTKFLMKYYLVISYETLLSISALNKIFFLRLEYFEVYLLSYVEHNDHTRRRKYFNE